MMVLEYEDSIVVVDVGLRFPTAEMVGIDLVLPDFSYLRSRVDDIEGIVVTHGHEDHLGALPWVLRELAVDIPVYGGPLTTAMARSKLDEHRLREVDVNDVRDGERVQLGPFDVELVHMTHSIPDSCGVALHTDLGTVVVTCFASNIHRVQQVVDAAAAHGRKVSLVGRSMRKNVNIGRSLGHIEVPEGILVPPRELDDWPDHKLVIVSTGSQGEPLSALRRMAHRDHPQVELHDGDTVLFSATPIPGNERAVNETIDRLYHIGCDVITPRDAPIHASGHGNTEELKLMLNLVRPRYVMPAHGDHKRIHLHGQLAEAVGIGGDRVFKLENGLPLEIDEAGARVAERERAG